DPRRRRRLPPQHQTTAPTHAHSNPCHDFSRASGGYAMNSKFLEISNLDKAFPTPKGEITVVKGFDLTLREGEFVTLIGHSGCGKSTVLSIVAGLARATAGGILLAGREVTEAGPDRGVAFQAPCLLPWLSGVETGV